MKTIGLLGGMSWQSTALYYQLLNQAVSNRLGGLHSARIVLVSVDFQPIETLMQQGDWQQLGEHLAMAARNLEQAGAAFFLICTNTMHKVAETITAAVDIPLLHIADATALRIKAANMHTVGLLGTKATMEEDFYRGRLTEKYGLEVIVPPPDDRTRIDNVIFQELCRGTINKNSRDTYLRIIETMRGQGAEAIILGCTEIGMLVTQDLTAVPLFDTTVLHAEQAVGFALGEAGDPAGSQRS